LSVNPGLQKQTEQGLTKIPQKKSRQDQGWKKEIPWEQRKQQHRKKLQKTQVEVTSMAVKSKAKSKSKVIGKSDLIAAIADKTNRSKKDAAETLNVVLDTIQENLKKGKGVRLIPFGSFEIRERKGRTGRNPRTGEKINIKARKVPAFRPGKALRDAVK
jgi:DNA-binding protein HU-beta